MFSLSVCLIVKNEEKVLERCLNCVKQFADEIIVVDTGSKDKTKEIAFSFTSKVYDFEWVNDFSAARNFSFSKANCDYIMWLDADDIVTRENIDKINLLKINNSNTDVFMLKYAIQFDENGNSTFSYERERILRRNKNFLWKGFVHEVIVPSGVIEHLDITVEHHKVENTNPKRNLKIYNQKLKEGVVFSPREQFYYSRELFYNKFYKKCIKNLKFYLKNDNLFLPNKLDAHKLLAQCHILTNEKEQAKKILFSSFMFKSPSAEICCLIGSLLIDENLYDAEFWFKCATNCKKDFSAGSFIEEEYYDFIPYLQLCYINYKLGNYEKAKTYHKKTKALRPKNASVLYNEKFFTN